MKKHLNSSLKQTAVESTLDRTGAGERNSPGSTAADPIVNGADAGAIAGGVIGSLLLLLLLVGGLVVKQRQQQRRLDGFDEGGGENYVGTDRPK